MVLCGCATNPNPPSGGKAWTADRMQRELCGEDEWEGFNRSMFFITDTTMDYIAPPLCTLYSSIVPRPLVDGIDNAVDNSEYPIRLVATLLRGEWGGAWDETCRFTINTTLGLGGLFDPAANLFGIFSTDASLAGTFAAWGVAQGPPLAIPFVPRANVRDVCGRVLDYGLDPKTYIDFFLPFPPSEFMGWGWTLWPNYAAVYSDLWDDNLAPLPDRYHAYMQALSAKSLLDEDLSVYRYATAVVAGTAEVRRPAVRAPLARPVGLEGRWRDLADYEPRTPALDTLRCALFTPRRDHDFWWCRRSIFNSDYYGEIDYREVAVSTNRPAARYGFVAAPAAATPELRRRLVFIIPGVGGDAKSKGTVAMSELLHDAGVATVLCDDPFCWQFLTGVNQGRLPGYLPDDARRFAGFMRAVVADLVADGLIEPDPRVSVAGWSMGGLLTAHLAALDSREGLGLQTGEFLAVNPPAKFECVTAALDRLLEPTLKMSLQEAKTNTVEISRRLLFWDESGLDLTPDLSETDAGFVVATTLGYAVPQLAAFAKCTNRIETASEYFDLALAAEHPEKSIADLTAGTGLRAIAAELAANGRLAVIHTRDDFLLDDDDRAFLDHTLKDRITWFSAGAHCGMFYTPEFKAEVLERLNLPPTDGPRP